MKCLPRPRLVAVEKPKILDDVDRKRELWGLYSFSNDRHLIRGTILSRENEKKLEEFAKNLHE